MSNETRQEALSTADLAAAAQEPTRQRETAPVPENALREDQPHDTGDQAQLAPLFLPNVSDEFRARWDAVQIGFVDDPMRAVRDADELVARVMKSLAETFSEERAKLEGQVDQSSRASTENLRIALRNYRSFFQRLLSL